MPLRVLTSFFDLFNRRAESIAQCDVIAVHSVFELAHVSMVGIQQLNPLPWETWGQIVSLGWPGDEAYRESDTQDSGVLLHN